MATIDDEFSRGGKPVRLLPHSDPMTAEGTEAVLRSLIKGIEAHVTELRRQLDRQETYGPLPKSSRWLRNGADDIEAIAWRYWRFIQDENA